MYSVRHSTRSLLVACTLSFELHAQAAKVELLGIVRDSAGLEVAGATASATNLATGFRQSVRTGSDGRYHLFGLLPGRYDVQIEASGFAAFIRPALELALGDRQTLDVALTVGDVQQSVAVSAAAPLLETTRGSVSRVVDQRRIVTLPIDGRNFVPLIALAPGVNLPPTSTLPRINGSRPRVSEYIYDGISVLQPEPGQVAYFPVLDAIDEFRVETNSYSAEYGRANGGVIIVNQKYGGNALHGTVFEFLRNEALNARNLFAPTGAKPQFRRNQYGFVMGGPIQTNRTFYFVDWQGTRQSTGNIRLSTVPTNAQRSGRFSNAIFDPATTQRVEAGFTRQPFAGNVIPAARFDAATVKVLDRYPAPNQFSATGAELTANNYRRVGNELIAQDQFDTRLDRYFGTAHRLFGRYAYLRDHSQPITPLPDGSGNIASGV
ncbi:MAG: carboxypeptidase-like regulatory domain-containing protein, partial [Acidobacteria bacterium]|nr:carboxypeptidase-like regulatory domain-containing protein [Acidobacteriota bacterium]